MAFLFVIMLGLNIVQSNKDIQRCKEENFEAQGCSIYKKMNLNKVEVKK